MPKPRCDHTPGEVKVQAETLCPLLCSCCSPGTISPPQLLKGCKPLAPLHSGGKPAYPNLRGGCVAQVEQGWQVGTAWLGADPISQLRRQSVKEEEAPRGSKADTEKKDKKEEEEETKPAAPSTEEKSQLRSDWRLYRGHHPLSFLGLEDPLFLRHNYYRSPAFDPDYPFPRKSAFSPYNRRVSEGSYRFSPESMYSRAYYSNVYSPVFKKD